MDSATAWRNALAVGSVINLDLVGRFAAHNFNIEKITQFKTI
jgi:hypothetical protein